MEPACSQIPEAIRKSIERFSDEEFWKKENLEKRLKANPDFGAVLSYGFDGLLKDRFKEGTIGYHAVQMYTLILMKEDWVFEERIDAVYSLLKFSIEYYGLSPAELTAQRFLAAAYLEEANTFRKFGMASSQVPLSTSLFVLNHDRPLALKIQQTSDDLWLIEQGTEILREVFCDN